MGRRLIIIAVDVNFLKFGTNELIGTNPTAISQHWINSLPENGKKVEFRNCGMEKQQNEL